MSLPAHACSRPSASPSVAAAGAVGMWTTADIGVSIDRSLGAQFAARISALQLHKTEIDPQSLAAATLLILLFHRLLGAGSGGAQKKSQVGGGLQPSAARLALGLALVAAQLCGAAADGGGGGGGGGWRGGNATSAVLRWSEQKLFGAYSTAQATAVGNVSPAFENNKLFSICLALAVVRSLTATTVVMHRCAGSAVVLTASTDRLMSGHWRVLCTLHLAAGPALFGVLAADRPEEPAAASQVSLPCASLPCVGQAEAATDCTPRTKRPCTQLGWPLQEPDLARSEGRAQAGAVRGGRGAQAVPG